MLSVFLLQLAGGSMIVVGLSRIHDVAWRYLRLMAVVSLVLLCLAAVLVGAEYGWSAADLRHEPYWTILVAIALALIWLTSTQWQQGRTRNSQRLWTILGGWFGVGSAGVVAQAAVFDLGMRLRPPLSPQYLAAATTATVLGGLLAGSVTTTMLLGHRYLTDTGMTIAPLRRLTQLFIGAIVLRAIGVAAAIFMGRRVLLDDDPARMWVLFFLSVRIGVGIFGTGVLAYMIWDCVRRRSTQSATGILYIAMVFVFIGELTAQYLLRWKGLAV